MASLSMHPVAANDESIARACEHLAAGRLIGVPTETVYGLAANAFDPVAVRRIFAAKGRPDNNPLIVHVADIDRLAEVVRWPLDRQVQRRLDAISDLWPGPLTVVLPRGEQIPDEVTAGLSTVAVRVPSHWAMQALLRRCPFPLAAPSANRSKYVSPTTAQHVLDGLSDRVAMVLDGGTCSVGLESTIVSLSPTLRVLRPGVITAETLAQRWQVAAESLLAAEFPTSAKTPTSKELSTLASRSADGDAPTVLEAPGMMLQHYSPTTPLAFVDTEPVGSAERIGRIAFTPLSHELQSQYAVVRVLSETGDLREVASRLFASLRELDSLQLDRIVVDQCVNEGIGRAIMDRLRRGVANH